MDIRKLNEKLDGILNEEEFSFNGVKNIISDLIKKYGNLTIPEFIDMLIKKEKNGEDVLVESYILQEDADRNKLNSYGVKFLDMFIKKLSKVKLFYNLGEFNHGFPKEINNLKKEVIKSWADTSYTNDRGKNHTRYLMEDVKLLINKNYNNYFEASVPGGYTSTEIDVNNSWHTYSELYNPVISCGFYEKEKDGVTDPYSLQIQIKMMKHLFNLETTLDRSKFENTFSADMGGQYGFGQIIALNTTLDCDDDEAFEETAKEIISEIMSIINKSNEIERRKLTGERERVQQAKDAATSEFEELAKARREARANRKAANTTIKQALSKSSVAKKIQALQNPTPEQLAKILAAIEG